MTRDVWQMFSVPYDGKMLIAALREKTSRACVERLRRDDPIWRGPVRYLGEQWYSPDKYRVRHKHDFFAWIE